MLTRTILTHAQHERLDRIADEDAGARMARLGDWSSVSHPLVYRADGRKQEVLPSGRIRPRGKLRAPDLARVFGELATA